MKMPIRMIAQGSVLCVSSLKKAASPIDLVGPSKGSTPARLLEQAGQASQVSQLPLITDIAKRERGASVCSSSSRISKELDDEEDLMFGVRNQKDGESTSHANKPSSKTKAFAKDKIKKE